MAAMAKIVCSTSIQYGKDEITVKYMFFSRPNRPTIVSVTVHAMKSARFYYYCYYYDYDYYYYYYDYCDYIGLPPLLRLNIRIFEYKNSTRILMALLKYLKLFEYCQNCLS